MVKDESGRESRRAAKLRRPPLRIPAGISLRIFATCWTVSLLTLGLYLTVNLPQQKRDLLDALGSKAQGVSSSLQDITASAAMTEDYSTVVEHCVQVLKGDEAIEYLVITKADGFSVVVDRNGWRTETLGQFWRPSTREVIGEIAHVALVGKTVFRYARPFDYSAIHWGWVNIGLSTQAYDRSVARVYHRSAVLVVLGAGLSLLISFTQARRLVRPIVDLQSVVGQVARGDLSARAKLQSGDEVEDLARSFNTMTDTIENRNRILESVRYAGQQLLSADDWTSVVGGVLAKVGQAAEVSRVYVVENEHAHDGAVTSSERHEWVAPGIHSTIANWQRFRWAGSGLEEWGSRLAAGQVVVAHLPQGHGPAAGNLDPSIHSIVSAPIRTGDAWWGLLGFDECRRNREWGEADKNSFQAIADMFGAAIARQSAKKALEVANETLECRVLERTQEVQTARQLLAHNLERLDLALDGAEEALWDWNVADNRTYYSDRWSRMLGYSPDEIGDSVEIWERLVHPDDLAVASEKLRSHLEGKCESYQSEYRMKAKDGGWRWIRARGKVVARAGDGSPLRFAGTHLDITANKKAEDALVKLSREAGMAEVATGVLHNVGNVLNSINVSTTIVANKVRESRIANVVSLAGMLQEHSSRLPDFLNHDPKGRRVVPYLAKLGSHLEEERRIVLQELGSLTEHVGHVKAIISTQQEYAKVSGLNEVVSLQDLVEDAIRIGGPKFDRQGIRLERDYEAVPPAAIDKHSVLQILLNLLRNAEQAIENSDNPEKRIRVRVRGWGEDRVRVIVEDTGVGVPPENLARIFSHGFTTRQEGHGFGLHSGANAARQMRGMLWAESDGLGRGAAFILELPLKAGQKAKETQCA